MYFAIYIAELSTRKNNVMAYSL